MPPAARFNDEVLHDVPHCHAPIHPATPTPTPAPHPPVPLKIVLAVIPTVLINKLPAAVVNSMTQPCLLPSCVPAGPGFVLKGSMSVFTGGLPAARLNDIVNFPSCVAPIPSPFGKIIPPCSPNVIIGG